jgi:glutamine synthetase
MFDLNPRGLLLFMEAHPQILFVKWTWVSCSGSVYARLLTKSRCQILAASNRGLRPNTSCIAGLIKSSLLEPSILSTIGEVQVVPDWESLRLSSSTEAIVQCFLHENIKLYQTLKDPVERCPRTCLRRTVLSAKENLGLSFLAGFELEFYLLEVHSNYDGQQTYLNPPLDHDLIPWSSSQRLHGKRADCLRKCMLALEDAGIIVEHGHPEGSMYQFEIATGPLQPLEAVDAFYTSRDIIKGVALACGYHATFVPKPFPKSDPSGLHLHLSAHYSTSTLLQDEDKRIEAPMARMFLAGILNRLPALCAISMPSLQSYLRGANEDTMGEYAAWGKSNHSVPLNEVAEGYWEVRSMDATANLYLAVAAYIGAGILGITRMETLPSRNPGVTVESLTTEDRIALGIIKRLPVSLHEALREMNDSALDLGHILGPKLLELYNSVKENELKRMETWDEAKRLELFMFHF